MFLPFVCVLDLASQAEHSCLSQMPCKWMLHDGHRHGSHQFWITHRPYPENAHHSSGTSDHMYTMHGAHAMQRPEIGILVFLNAFVCILQCLGWRLRPYSRLGLITNAHNQALTHTSTSTTPRCPISYSRNSLGPPFLAGAELAHSRRGPGTK